MGEISSNKKTDKIDTQFTYHLKHNYSSQCSELLKNNKFIYSDIV